MVPNFFDPSLIKQMMPKQGLSSTPSFDLKAILELNRKNTQALTDATQMAFEGVQEAVSRQTELMTQMMQDNSQIATTIMTDGTPEQKVQRQTELMRKSYESTVRNARELSEIISKSGEDVAGIISRRITASLNEFKSAFDTKGASEDAPSFKKETATPAVKKPAVKKRRVA